MDHVFSVIFKKLSPNPKSYRVSSTLSPGIFVILHFTFRTVIHQELIFVRSIRSVPRFIYFFLHMDVLASFVAKASLSSLNCLYSLLKISSASGTYKRSNLLYKFLFFKYYSVISRMGHNSGKKIEMRIKEILENESNKWWNFGHEGKKK